MTHYDYDVSDWKIRVWWWCFWLKDQSMLMMFLIERSEYDDGVSMLMMFLIERSECDDDYVWQIRIWWWCCCWSKGQGAEDVVIDRKVKMLKMLPIKRTKCWRCCCWSKNQSVEDVADRKFKMLKMSLLIEQSKCWRCCWSKGPSAEDVVANWKIKMLKMLLLIEPVKVLKMLLIKRSKCWICRCKLKDQNAEDVVDDKDWRLKMKTTWCWKYSNDL